MKSKDMFEKLGYEKYGNDPLSYRLNDGGYINFIDFIHIQKTIRFREYEEYENNQPQGSFLLNIKELQAINQQCKELGWLDEEI